MGIVHDKFSLSERETVSIVRSNMKYSDSGYIVQLPFKDDTRPSVNYRTARGKLNKLIHHAARDEQFGQQYNDVVKTYIEKEFIEQIPYDHIEGHYLLHHTVFKKSATTPLHIVFNPLTLGKGEISLPNSRAIFSKLKNEDKDLFSFRNCKKWCKKAKNAIISLSLPFYVNWQPPENRQCIGERGRRKVAKRGFGSPQAVVYEWTRLSIALPYADHLFSMTQKLLPHFC